MDNEQQEMSATELIKTLLSCGLSDYKENKSRASELVKLKISKEKVKAGKIHLKVKVIGKVTNEVHETYELRFKKILYPYYYLELIKLAIKVYWSGKKMDVKMNKRIAYMNQFGEKNKEYFNRSFRYIYWIKKPLMTFRK